MTLPRIGRPTPVTFQTRMASRTASLLVDGTRNYSAGMLRSIAAHGRCRIPCRVRASGCPLRGGANGRAAQYRRGRTPNVQLGA